VSHSVTAKLLNEIVQRGRGYVFTPAEVLHLGSRAAVDQGLSRLAKAGRIKRLARGVYAYPERNSLVGEVPPSPTAVAEALVRAQSAQAQVSEAAAANALGLTTQVPGRVVYLTNGTPRRRRVGNTVIEFKRASPRRLAGAGTPVGTVVQALRYLGPTGANEQVAKKLRANLPRRQRQALRALIPLVPAWMRPTIHAIVATPSRG
jgi:predicted transcriptional regulator of viral defense system